MAIRGTRINSQRMHYPTSHTAGETAANSQSLTALIASVGRGTMELSSACCSPCSSSGPEEVVVVAELAPAPACMDQYSPTQLTGESGGQGQVSAAWGRACFWGS